MKICKLVISLILSLCFFSCENREKTIDKSILTGYDYRLFQNTKSWELAKALEDNDLKNIIKIINSNKNLIDKPDPQNGFTPLMFTIYHRQDNLINVLLDLGANPNVYSKKNGTSAIILACKDKDIDIKIIRKLIDKGAKANDIELGVRDSGNSTRYSPLIAAAKSRNLDLVKLLLEKGADVNYENEFKQSAVTEALLHDRYENVLELLKNGASCNQTVFERPNRNKKLGILEVLREDMQELDSPEYIQKMKLVTFLKTKGLNYSKEPIPESIIEKAKEKYHNNWQEYLNKY